MPSLPSHDDDISAVDQIRAYVDKLSKSGQGQQLVVGGSTGFLTGYFSSKVSRWVAIAGGVTLLAALISKEKGYISFNEKTWKNDMEKVRQKIEEQLDIPQENEVVKYAKKNSYVLASFVGGFLIGWGIA